MSAPLFMEEPARRTPVKQTDVFIAGAGTAGCIAAIAAARAGAKVVLVEKTGPTLAQFPRRWAKMQKNPL